MFTHRFNKSIARTTLAAAALGMAALISAGAANAGSVDDAFLAELKQDGLIPHSSAAAISNAKAVCNLLGKGYSPDAVVAAVAKVTGLSTTGANTFAVDAAKAYCPQYVKNN
jgi:Protein of unknown function (DUF732)